MRGRSTAELIRRHPSLELARVTARTDAGTRLNELYPQYAVDLVLEEPVAEDGADVDAAIVAYPHGAAAPVVAALRGQGTKVVDLSADFRLHDLDTYGRWYGEHGAPQLLDEAVYGLTELHREAIAERRARRQPGLLSDRQRAGAGAAGRRGPDRGRRDRRQVGRVRRRAGGGGGDGRRQVDDERSPYKVDRPPPHPEIAQELAELAGGNGAAPDRPDLRSASDAVRPGRAGELLRAHLRADRSGADARPLRGALRG